MMKSRFLLVLIITSPLFLCSAQEKGEMPVILAGASEYRNYEEEPFTLIDNYLDYYRNFSDLYAETQKTHIFYFHENNVDPVQIVAVLNLAYDDVKFAFLGEILEGMHISTTGGCAGCFGDGTMGERDPYVQYEYEKKDPQRLLQ